MGKDCSSSCCLANLRLLQISRHNSGWQVMNAAEHFMCTDIEWDPTGRFVATAVNHMHQMENGFNLWTFNGHLVYRCYF